MTTEDFDDVIRRKLKSITIPPTTDEEVAAIANYVNRKRNRIILLKWIRFIAILFGVTVAAVLIYSKVKDKIGFGNQVKAENKVEVKAKAKVEVGNNNSDKNVEGNQNSKSGAVVKNKPSSKRLDARVPVSNPALNDPPPIAKQQQPLVPEPIIPRDTASSIVKEKNEIQEIPIYPLYIHPTSYPFSITKLIQPNEAEGTASRKNKFPKLKPGFATGIGFDLGTSYMSYGLVEEISFLKRWSITTGIKYSATYHEKFKDVNEYQKIKNEAFTHKYDPDGYNYSILDITNIDIQTKSFQVPLFINYKIGLKNNFNLLLGAGTNFVIYSSQEVKFNNTLTGPIQEPHSVSFVNHYIGPMFRDINIGVGLQHVWKHFSIDARPNLGVMINNPNNDKKVSGGVRVRVMCGI